MSYYVRVFSVSPCHQNLQKLSHNCRILHLHERALPVFLNGDETFVLSNKQSFFLITNFLHVDSQKYWALRVGLAFPRRVTPTVVSGRPRPARHPGRRPHARWAARRSEARPRLARRTGHLSCFLPSGLAARTRRCSACCWPTGSTPRIRATSSSCPAAAGAARTPSASSGP